jgi:purine catabolism regulator
LGADLVELLLNGTEEEGTVVSRFARLGYDLSSERRHLVIALRPADEGAGDAICHHVSRDLEWATQREDAIFLATGYREYTLVFLSVDPQVSEWRLRHRIQEGLSSSSGQRCQAGISRLMRGMAGLQDAVCQAVDALTLGQCIVGRKSPHYYEELGLYRLLAGLRNRDELLRFCEETLGDLVRYDDAHGTDLLYTLEVFFDQNANVSKASKALYVHRNTLNYRLQRIVEISGLDLNNAEARLALQLALKAHRLSS